MKSERTVTPYKVIISQFTFFFRSVAELNFFTVLAPVLIDRYTSNKSNDFVSFLKASDKVRMS